MSKVNDVIIAIKKSFEFMCFHLHFAEQIYMHHLCKEASFAKVMHVNLFSKVRVKTHKLKRSLNGNTVNNNDNLIN